MAKETKAERKDRLAPRAWAEKSIAKYEKRMAAPKSSGSKIPRKKRPNIADAMRLAKRPCPECGSIWRRVKAYPCGKRALGTPILCYMKASHKLTAQAKKLQPRAKEDIAHQEKQLKSLGIDPKGVTYDKR